MPKPKVLWTQSGIIKRVEMIPFSGCWIWMRGCSAAGYGAVTKDGKNIKAHRISYELFRGSTPTGKFVLHSCDVKQCINPNHLFIGSAKDNTQDALSKGIWHPAFRLIPGLASRASKSVSAEAKSKAGKIGCAVRWGDK